MIEAVLRVSLPCSWATRLTDEFGASVNIVEQKSLDRNTLRTLVEIDPGVADPASVAEAVRRSPGVIDMEAIVPKKGKILATMQVRDCHACQLVSDSECFLADASATTVGRLEWNLLAARRSSIEVLVKALRERELDPEVVSIRSAKASSLLTERQEKIIKLAFRLGFFEFPKRINLTSLAKKLGVSKSTLSETLRSGESKIVHAYFQGRLAVPR